MSKPDVALQFVVTHYGPRLAGIDQGQLVGVDLTEGHVTPIRYDDVIGLANSDPAAVFYGVRLAEATQRASLAAEEAAARVRTLRPRGHLFAIPPGFISGFAEVRPTLEALRSQVPHLDAIRHSAVFAGLTIRTHIGLAERAYECVVELYRQHGGEFAPIEKVRDCIRSLGLPTTREAMYREIQRWALVVQDAIRRGLRDRALRRYLVLETEMPTLLSLAKVSFMLALLGQDCVCLDARIVKRANLTMDWGDNTALDLARYERAEDAFLAGNPFYDPTDPLGRSRAQWASWETSPVRGEAKPTTHAVWLNIVRPMAAGSTSAEEACKVGHMQSSEASKPIVVTKRGAGEWTMTVMGKPVVRVGNRELSFEGRPNYVPESPLQVFGSKTDAQEFAHFVGKYILGIGSFVDTYTEYRDESGSEPEASAAPMPPDAGERGLVWREVNDGTWRADGTGGHYGIAPAEGGYRVWWHPRGGGPEWLEGGRVLGTLGEAYGVASRHDPSRRMAAEGHVEEDRQPSAAGEDATIHSLHGKYTLRPVHNGVLVLSPKGQHVGIFGDQAEAEKAIRQHECSSAEASECTCDADYEAHERLLYRNRKRFKPSAFALPERRKLPMVDNEGRLDIRHINNAAARLSMMRNRGSVTEREYESARARIVDARKRWYSMHGEAPERMAAEANEVAEDFAIIERDVGAVREGRKHAPLKDPKAVYEFLSPVLLKQSQEVFVVVPVDLHARPMRSKPFLVAMGQRDAVRVDTSDVLRPVIETNASGFIVAHNHPSASPEPSARDHELTGQIREASKKAVPSVAFLDHCVIGDGTVHSIVGKKTYRVA